MQDESFWVNERFENRIASGKSLQETSREFKHLVPRSRLSNHRSFRILVDAYSDKFY